METFVTKIVSVVLSLKLLKMEPKERISAKAEELFLQYGIRSVSMDDIAHNLGMSKKTLYQYFAEKDELVHAVIDNHITRMQSDCEICRTEASNAIHEIFITMERILDEFSNLNPMVLYDMEKFHYTAFKRFKEHKDKYLLQIVRRNIEWGIKEGLYREDVNIDVMSKYRMESMMIPFNVNVFPPGKYNLASISEMIIQNFTYGLATIKGHKLIQQYNDQRKKQISYE